MSRLLDDCLCEVGTVTTIHGMHRGVELLTYDKEFLMFRETVGDKSSIVVIPRENLRSIEFEETSDGRRYLSKDRQRKNPKVSSRAKTLQSVPKNSECKDSPARQRLTEKTTSSKGEQNS